MHACRYQSIILPQEPSAAPLENEIISGAGKGEDALGVGLWWMNPTETRRGRLNSGSSFNEDDGNSHGDDLLLLNEALQNLRRSRRPASQSPGSTNERPCQQKVGWLSSADVASALARPPVLQAALDSLQQALDLQEL